MVRIKIHFITFIFTVIMLTFAQAKDSGQIYVFESSINGFNTKTIFYDDGKEVIAFDAQFTEGIAQEAIDYLKTKTQNPIKYLVITHPNPDKFNGIPAFKKAGATIVMSKLSATNMKEVHNYKKYYFVEIAKMFTNETYPKLPTADLIFEKKCTIQLANGGIVKLTELQKKGMATNQTLASIESVNALIVGDLIHSNVHAWLEGPIIDGVAVYDNTNWINTLKTIKSKYSANTLVYGGRGDVGKLSSVVDNQILYLQKAKKLINEYLSSIGGDKANVDYKQLQKKFEIAFPNYNLGYMIAYGAYGIVASIK